ncbi:MAG: M20/M25/M40 family metallo-hydrolase [Oscillospiraceae bacterium]|nr:M20/M25/M40 family metallo-hydrolase [Oscillospiraceae bacterium]
MVVLWIALGLLAALLAVVLVRAALFRPKKTQSAAPAPVEADERKAIDTLADMVRCKTVSSRDAALTDKKEFDKFRKLLTERFPNVHKTCSLEHIGPTGLLYLWKGKSDKQPTVLMSHYDVVPADESAWDKPPFEGLVENDVLWGRGTLDNKCTLCGIMNAAEQLIGEGFVPENDVYFSFAGDEEIAGDSAPAIVAELEKRGVTPALVLDEGGAVVEDVFPGVTDRCALIGIGEKGMMDLEFNIKSAGGHASAPPPHGPVGKLAQAVADVENHPFPIRLGKPVAEMFDTLGRRSSFLYRMIFANLWLFLPVLDSLCKKSGGEPNAMMRTTCAFTMMEGSKASNVMPPEAHVVANLRLAEGDTQQSAVEYIKKTIRNDEIELKEWYGMNPSIASDTASDGYKKLRTAVEQTWEGAIVSPYLMVQCSDSRHFCRITDKVMRFSAAEFTKAERSYIHGNNERIPVDKIVTTVKFYIRLIKQC